MWDVPTVITTKADSRRRVVVPQVKPGHVYAVQDTEDGSIRLTLLAPPKPVKGSSVKARLEKRGKYTVGVTDKPIDMDALHEALANFP